jgi:hypothetical protein
MGSHTQVLASYCICHVLSDHVNAPTDIRPDDLLVKPYLRVITAVRSRSERGENA